MQYLLSIVNKYLVEDIFVEKLWDNFKGQYVWNKIFNNYSIYFCTGIISADKDATSIWIRINGKIITIGVPTLITAVFL